MKPSSPLRRQLLAHAAGMTLLGGADLARAARLLALRVWPAREYSRITLESDETLRQRHSLSADPHRLTLDIEGLAWQPALREAAAQVPQDDPNIVRIEVAQPQPGAVQLAIGLRHAVRAQVFQIRPVAQYQHRLVLDLYPQQAIDPLEALIADLQRRGAPYAADYPDVRETGKRWAGIVGQRVMDESGQPRELVAMAIQQSVTDWQAEMARTADARWLASRIEQCQQRMAADLAADQPLPKPENAQ